MVVECFDVFQDMEHLNIKFDHVKLSAMLTACGHTGIIDIVVDLFNVIESRFEFVLNREHCEIVRISLF